MSDRDNTKKPRAVESREEQETVGKEKYLPLVVGVLFGGIWVFLYLLMGTLNGMWAMTDQGFPFLFSVILGIHAGKMTPVLGATVAFLDGAFVGVIGGLILRGGTRWGKKGEH